MAWEVFGAAEPEGLREHLVIDGCTSKGSLFGGAERHDAVVEVRDENVAALILHAS